MTELITIGVVLTRDRNPIIIRDIDIDLPTHSILGEQFAVRNDVSDFLYDWLRNREKRIIGVRFIHDSDDGYDHVLGRRNVVNNGAEGWPNSFTIFFGPEREFEPTEHLHLDFGCRELYIGSNGSTMFTFCLESSEKLLGED